ncbi:alpha/beta fold hydrolase [Phenylobacterium sp.]|uniref:alpha/beta fold hydrolase n=1 Tax=Phenylobacterium sp. TaxID=1871053 RepID=UPI00398342D9
MAELAPLTDIPSAPVPAGGEAEWFRGAGGAKLRAALFTPLGKPRGSMVVSGGRTEPIEKYFEFIGDCLEQGFVVLAHDWRGQGLSARDLPDRLKGHARGHLAFLEDFRCLLSAYQARLPKPWVAVGHSMGGCLTLLALAHGESRFAGAILSAPMLGVRTGKVARPVARTLAGLNVITGRGGRYTLGQAGKPFDDTFDGNVLTHDAARFARHRAQIAANPELALGNPTWGWLDFALRATAFLAKPERLRGVTIPVVIVSAEQDKLVDNAAQQAATRNLPQGRFISVPGAYHEILMETDHMRNIFMRALDALTGKVAPKPSPAPKPLAPTPPAAPMAVAPKPKPAAAKKPAARKPAKAAARKPAAVKKPTAKAPTAAKAAAAKPAKAKKPAPAKKPAARKSLAAKPAAAQAPAAAKKAPAKKVAAKKPAAKKPATRKPA